jgi:hypothetical protein
VGDIGHRVIGRVDVTFIGCQTANDPSGARHRQLDGYPRADRRGAENVNEGSSAEWREPDAAVHALRIDDLTYYGLSEFRPCMTEIDSSIPVDLT